MALPLFYAGNISAQDLDSEDDFVPEQERLENIWEIDKSESTPPPTLWEPSPAEPIDPLKEPETLEPETSPATGFIFPLNETKAETLFRKQLQIALDKPDDQLEDHSFSDVDFNVALDAEELLYQESENCNGECSAVGSPHTSNSTSSPISGQVGQSKEAIFDMGQTAEADREFLLPTYQDRGMLEEVRLQERMKRERQAAAAQSAASASIGAATLIPEERQSVIADGKLLSQNDQPTQALEETKEPEPTQPKEPEEKVDEQKKILVNFNDVNIIEYLRFISRHTNKNFIFDEADLQFNVTIISEEPTTIENILTALVQELRVHGLSLIEQGNNFIIHQNQAVNSISKVVSETYPDKSPAETELITKVFQLNTLDVEKAADIVLPLVSDTSIVESLKETNHLIITDLSTNIEKISQLLKSIDAPNSGMVVGQYVVRNAFLGTIIEMAQQLIAPLAQDQPVIFVPHSGANSIFIVSTPFLVEKTISLLQRLDQTQGTTRIYDLKQLQFLKDHPTDPSELMVPKGGYWEIDSNGNWRFVPAQDPATFDPNNPPSGGWDIAPDGNWEYTRDGTADGPKGRWVLDPQGIWVFQLNQGESITPDIITRKRRKAEGLPVGSIERTKFYIHKLEFRSGENISEAIQRIGESMAQSESVNIDLLNALLSVQWLETSNSLVFTGDEEALRKVKELVEEIDIPLRQVFIEMLILQTTVTDSLQYGVNFATRFNNGDARGAQAMLDGGSPLFTLFPQNVTDAETNAALLQPSGLVTNEGYTLGIIGESITRNGQEFASIAALVRALHRDDKVQVVLNPKIITEDNQPAEIFVGENRPFQSQAISNDEGSVITQNVEFRDVGTRLRVTPLLGNTDIITLIIDQELSAVQSGQGANDGTVTPGTLQTTTKSTTTTRVHIPDGYFLVISGLIRDRDENNTNGVPCLGGAPLIGGLFKSLQATREKNNIMTFIRPQIIDTDEEIQNLTRHQQDIYRLKSKIPEGWKYETERALDFLNIKKICDCDCTDCKYQYEEDWFTD